MHRIHGLSQNHKIKTVYIVLATKYRGAPMVNFR